MPKNCDNLKEFIEKCQTTRAGILKKVTMFEKKTGTKYTSKFKVRTKSGLHTLKINDRTKASKLKSHLRSLCELVQKP